MKNSLTSAQGPRRQTGRPRWGGGVGEEGDYIRSQQLERKIVNPKSHFYHLVRCLFQFFYFYGFFAGSKNNKRVSVTRRMEKPGETAAGTSTL